MKETASIRFDWRYAVLTAAIFIIEVLIALFVNDSFVRPFVGDTLVVILIYCFLLTFFDLPRRTTAVVVLLFAFFIEILQFFRFVDLIGLGENRVARIVIGTTFSVLDLVAYTAGFLVILFFGKIVENWKR